MQVSCLGYWRHALFENPCSAPLKVSPAFRSNLFALADRREGKKDFHCNQVYERGLVLLFILYVTKRFHKNRSNAEIGRKITFTHYTRLATDVYPKKHAVTYLPGPGYSDCCWFQIRDKIRSAGFYHKPLSKQAAA